MYMTRWQDVNGIYQIYPRSFKDTNGDGVGDLAGITQQLDYIKGGKNALGIDAIWISPFYRSPMDDFGYDIADYYSIDPLFGDLEDFKQLLEEAHKRSIKVMIDYVPNHTSDQHPWFIASKSSRDNPKRDWYVWRDPQPDGSAPNNWLSVFGGSSWQLDEGTGQYYLHSFLTQQPDLNWDNPEVREAMKDVLRFWLDMGVDGIRADAVRWLSKDTQLRDNPPNPDYDGRNPFNVQIHQYSRYGENLWSYLTEIAEVIEQYPDCIILFEDYPDKHRDRVEQYEGFYAVNSEVAAPFNFEGMKLSYNAPDFHQVIDSFQKILGTKLRPFYCFSNHDKPRLASRMGKDQARVIGLMQLTLPGIPVVYYGDEIGMQDGAILPEQVQDPFEKQTPGLGLGRDPERTPMQWSDELYAGFSTAEPWLLVADGYEKVNVAREQQDSRSSLHMYQVLLELRRSSPLRTGEYKEWSGANEKVFGFVRESSYEKLLILLNMSGDEVSCDSQTTGEVIYSTHDSVEMTDEEIVLRPNQGVVIRL